MATVEEFKVKVNVDGADKLDKLGSSAGNTASKMTGLATAILGVGFGAFVMGAARSADVMSDLSDATDITLGSIIAFGSALEQAGGKSRNTEKTILALYNAIELAADGGGKQQEAFNKLGISLDDLRTMSEADILNKTIAGLSTMTAGSERSAIAATLLSKSFRSVDPAKFADQLAKVKEESDRSAQGQQTLADLNQNLEKTFRNLQLAAGEVLGPVLEVFNGITESSMGAKTAVIAFSGVAALMFGGAAIAAAKEFISIYQLIAKSIKGAAVAQAALTALSGPKGWAILAGAAIATTAAYIALDKAMGDAATTAETAPVGASGASGVETKPGGKGTVNRQVKAYVSPEAQAAADSEKRILTSQAEWRKLTESSTTDEIKNIRLGAIADIEKMEIEVGKNKLLSATQKEKEIAERRKEINAKADFDIMKVRMEVEKTLAEQLKTLSRGTEERLKAFELEKQFNGLGASQLTLQQQLLEIEKKRTEEIDAATKAAVKDPGQLAGQIEAINSLAEKEKLIAQQRNDWSRQFSTGWSKAFGDYIDNATNAANIAKNMFDAMASSMNGAIDNFVETGKFSFSDLTNSILKDLVKIQLKASVAGLFGSVNGAAGAGGIMGLFSGLFRASGGPVNSNSPYIVGEMGPELFVPSSAGKVISNSQLNKSGGSGSMGITNVNYNISAVDALSFKQMIARDPTFLYAVTLQGQKAIPAARG